jgi:hypothetical protein
MAQTMISSKTAICTCKVQQKPAKASAHRNTIRVQAVSKQQQGSIANGLTAAAAAALLLASPAFAAGSSSSSAVDALKGKFFGPQDAIEQRKALGDFVDDKSDKLGIGRMEDATIDNPNDSPRPADRNRGVQPFSGSGSDFSSNKGEAEFQKTLNSTDMSGPDFQK